MNGPGSTTRHGDIVQLAEEVLSIDLLPWQADTLRAVAHDDYRSMTLVHPNRRGKRRGIEQMQAILDEWKNQWIDEAIWLSPEVALADVYRVAAKYLPRSNLDRLSRHADIPQMPGMLDIRN